MSDLRSVSQKQRLNPAVKKGSLPLLIKRVKACVLIPATF